MPVAAIVYGEVGSVALGESSQAFALLAAVVNARDEQHGGEQLAAASVAGLVDDEGVGEVVHVVLGAACDGKGKVVLQVVVLYGASGMSEDGFVGQQVRSQCKEQIGRYQAKKNGKVFRQWTFHCDCGLRILCV